MRGCAPLLVALGSVALIGEPLSAGAWTGVAVICMGVLTLGLSRSLLHAGDDAKRRKALRFALCNSAVLNGGPLEDRFARNIDLDEE